MKELRFWVYILFDVPAHATYIGVTNNLRRRVYEHKKGLVEGYTKKHNIDKLGYYEEYQYIDNAIAREKTLKKMETRMEISSNRNQESNLVGFVCRYR